MEGCFEKIGYPDRWDPRQSKQTGDQRKPLKPKPKAAAVDMETLPIPGLTFDRYTKLIKQLGDTLNLEVNMAS